MTIGQRALEAIEYSDTDELIRVVDGFCESASWDELVELKQRCSEAVTRGKQLWGVEEHIRYRLALEAPGPWAGAALSEGVARFSLGPLPEVAASTKTFREVNPHIEDGPWRQYFAFERVVRGDGEVDADGELPNRLQQWEPEYCLATYKSDKVESPSPDPVDVGNTPLPDTFVTVDDPQSEGVLADLVEPWVTESNGRCQVSCVDGNTASAIRALGLTKARTGELSSTEALRWMAWAAASGGAHGKRRGSASGRLATWWAIVTLCDLDWPPQPDEVGNAVSRLQFSWFDDGAPSTGWELRLGIEDPESGLAWAISAIDVAD